MQDVPSQNIQPLVLVLLELSLPHRRWINVLESMQIPLLGESPTDRERDVDHRRLFDGVSTEESCREPTAVCDCACFFPFFFMFLLFGYRVSE